MHPVRTPPGSESVIHACACELVTYDRYSMRSEPGQPLLRRLPQGEGRRGPRGAIGSATLPEVLEFLNAEQV